MDPAQPANPPGSCRYWIGTSGYNYPEWRGSFYPEKFPTTKMLPFYAERFRTVEINYTFYRVPNAKQLAAWSAATPDGFKFTLKAPRRITHDAKLQSCEDLLRHFCTTAQTLGDKLGFLLFQLPPSFKKNLSVLDAFIQWLPPGVRAALEFRHDSWHDEELFARLRARNLALCIADTDKGTTPLVATADYGYFRLRDEGYQDADIARWATTIREHRKNWTDVFVYFKHEEQGKGPEFAQRLMTLLVS
jgi:uncharacterized protein YecE (DUF72 family)